MSDETLCPHKIPRKKWTFDVSPRMAPEPRMICVMNADACPDCLRDRVLSLRIAFERLLAGERADALKIYYADIEGWL